MILEGGEKSYVLSKSLAIKLCHRPVAPLTIAPDHPRRTLGISSCKLARRPKHLGKLSLVQMWDRIDL